MKWMDVRSIPFKEMVKQYSEDTKCDDNLSKEMCLQMRGWKKIEGGFILRGSSLHKPVTLEDAVKIECLTDKWASEPQEKE